MNGGQAVGGPARNPNLIHRIDQSEDQCKIRDLKNAYSRSQNISPQNISIRRNISRKVVNTEHIGAENEPPESAKTTDGMVPREIIKQ